MNFLPKITLFSTLTVALSLQCSQATIRHAELKDLPQLIALNKKVAHHYFENIITTGYPDSPVAQKPELDEYLTSVTSRLNALFEQTLNAKNENIQHLLVAIDDQKPEDIIGLCFSQQMDRQAYIRYIIVDEDCRRKGVGSQLLSETINQYKDVDSCALKTFSHANEKVHAFYEKHGFRSDKKLVNLPTKHSAHADTITFVSYQLNLKK